MIGDILLGQSFLEIYDVEFYYAFVGICAVPITVWPSAAKK
jgi:hypothetical protein